MDNNPFKEVSKKRYYGEFYTPLNFSKKSIEYIDEAIGLDRLKTGEYRIWDMACGIGNLEYYLPKECMKYLYMSTIYENDVLYSKDIFKEASIFQYDYLNDDITLDGSFFDYKKIPKNLEKDLENENLKWLIFINPPYATSQVAGANSKSKKNVSKSLIREIMHKEGLGESSRELYVQFMFRIKCEFKNLDASLALFSKINYLKSNNNEKFRENVCRYKFINGFMFSSSNFESTSKLSPFPVGFIIWKLYKESILKKENITLDILNDKAEREGKKHVIIVERKKLLNKWIKRVRCKIFFVPLSSAIKIKRTGNDVRNRICEGFLGSLMSCGNDLQKQNLTAILSAPQASAGSLSITADNFEFAMITHTIRRIVRVNWMNSSDQFVIPNEKLTDETITDMVVWSLFAVSNQTVSIDRAFYKENVYKITNNFFPFNIEDVKDWCKNKNIISSFLDDRNRFVCNYMKSRNLSLESKSVLDIGRSIYKYFFENIDCVNKEKFKISLWDVGFWQIRKSLKDAFLANDLFDKLNMEKNKLRDKLFNISNKFIS